MAYAQNGDKEKRVLFVDDDLTARYLVSECLSSAGYHVETADDGRSGLDLFESGQFDIVITDLVMPELGGLQVLQTILTRSPDTPVIVRSGLGGFDDVREALKLGAYDYLTKEAQGVDPVTLLSAVDRAWEKLQLVRENREYHESLETKVADRTQDLQLALNRLRDFKKELNDRQFLKFLEMERREKKYRTLIQKSPTGIATLDSNLQITECNKAFIETLRFATSDAISSTSPESNSHFARSAFPEKIRQCISTLEEFSGTVEYLDPDGQARNLECTLTPISLDDSYFNVEVLFTVRDVTLENDERKRLQDAANYDDLTGLLKQGRFDDTLEATLEKTRASDGTLALLHIDIDNFRDFNTEHGHPVASEMLRIIGQRIKTSISTRRDFAFRTGGDEFAVILTAFSPDSLPLVVKRLFNKLSELYSTNVDGTERVLKCTFSVGVAPYAGAREQTAMDLYKAADQATFQAKEGGRNQIVFAEQTGSS